MSEKADFTGQINSKKLGGTGITEALIGKHHRAEKGNLVVVAAISVAGVHKDVKGGTGAVNYVIDDLEVAPDLDLGDGVSAAEHVRRLIRSFEYERKVDTDGTLFDQRGDEPTVEQVVAAGGRFEPHPFIPDDAAKDTPICDVCGLVEDAGPHAAIDSDFDDDEDDDTDDQADEETSTDEPPLDDDTDDQDTDISQPEGALA